MYRADERAVSDFCNGSSRVEDERGGLGPVANAPFPIPAHRTGRADLRHPAFRLASSTGAFHFRLNPRVIVDACLRQKLSIQLTKRWELVQRQQAPWSTSRVRSSA